jgi:biotin-dependent carboxylase-like uncharacterized protein
MTSQQSTNSNKHLTVLTKNGLCSIQDKGRPAAQHLGFTAGGASDEYAFTAANYLLGNSSNDAALEITLGQLSLKAHQHCSIAITGADCFATINGERINNWQAHQLKPDDILTFSTPKIGLHSYLAVYGGIQSKIWLESRSQSSTEQSLGFGEKPIAEASQITLNNNCVFKSEKFDTGKVMSHHFYTTQKNYTNTTPLVLRFIPQQLWFDLTQQQQMLFLQQPFTISTDSNRMGYRLSNIPEIIAEVISNQPAQLSKPVTYGTIQLPSNGQPIVLMKERQTIGGYPVLGGVIQTDLFRLSQLRPGEVVQFTPTNIAFAQQQIKAIDLRFTQ